MFERKLSSSSARPQPARRVMDMHAPGYVPAGLKPQAAPAPRPKPAARKRLLLVSVLTLAAVAIIGGTVFYVVHNRQAAASTTKRVQATESTYRIVDDPDGVKFSISKDFTAMSTDDLQKLNPHFIYGYQIPNVNDVQCIVSQTTSTKTVTVPEPQLVRGTFAQLQNNFPDAKAVWDQPLTLQNGRQAAELITTYRAGDGTEVKQVEVVANAGLKTTFAFCISPVPLYDYYLPKFNVFFTQLEVY